MEESSPPHTTTIIEVRKEHMVSPSTGKNSTYRTAYFLKPCLPKEEHKASDIPPPPHSTLSGTVTSNPTMQRLEVSYKGWLGPCEEWKTWIKQMQTKYEPLWIKAGIDQAIKASTFEINRNNDLVLGLAQRWCSKTNTFVFPWGEATITLEDINVFAGYSIFGDPITIPLESKEQKEAEKELIAARRIFNSTKSRKVHHWPWMKHFMENESKVEHEAFLALWLSRFVFPANSFKTILNCVFPVAIHLARGTRIALAPSVLASIYRDLTLFNNSISIATIKLGVTLWAPFQLVQIWALERFQTLQPYSNANIAQNQKPRMARWNKVKLPKVKDLNFTLDSAGARNSFLWRPYKNSTPLAIENEMQSFALCLRVSDLVGLGCKEQYFPHRVAMQFGMDQDIPGMAATCLKNPWINYKKPLEDKNLCKVLCSSQCLQPSVTSRYYDWWNQSKVGKEGNRIKDFDHCVVSISSSSEHLTASPHVKVEGEGSFGPPPGFTSKNKRDQVMDSDQEDELLVNELVSSSSCKVRCFEDELDGNGIVYSSPQYDETATSMTGGVRNFAKREDVLRGSKTKGSMEDGQTEDVEGERKEKDDTNGVDHIEGEPASSCIAEDIASNLENRIYKLEREVGKLKAEKFGSKVQNIGAKAKP